MTDRLGALNVSSFYAEGRTRQVYLGGVAVFEPPSGGFDLEGFTALAEGAGQVSRHCQRIVNVPGQLTHPMRMDDANVDIAHRVRRSTLPQPGSGGQFRELVARLTARPIDRRRLLWEMHHARGLMGGHVASVHNVHHALVDGVGALNIGQRVLDRSPELRDTLSPHSWSPRPAPDQLGLVADALTQVLRRPCDLLASGIAAVLGQTGGAWYGAAGRKRLWACSEGWVRR